MCSTQRKQCPIARGCFWLARPPSDVFWGTGITEEPWNQFWLVNASFSLPEWQAVKTIFFAACICKWWIQQNVNNIVTLFYSHRTMGWQSQENILVFKKFLQVRPRMNNRIPSVTNNNITHNLSFTGCDLYYTVNHLKKVSTVTRHFNVVWWLNRKTLKAAVIFW